MDAKEVLKILKAKQFIAAAEGISQAGLAPGLEVAIGIVGEQIALDAVQNPQLTPEMLDELGNMLDEDERTYGKYEVRVALRKWLDYQWSLMPQKRYTVEISIQEIDENGNNICRVRVGGPSEATTDLRSLDNHFDDWNVHFQEEFYSAANLPGTLSYLCDPTKRADEVVTLQKKAPQ